LSRAWLAMAALLIDCLKFPEDRPIIYDSREHSIVSPARSGSRLD
jgi:hypothetical protein